MSRLNSRIGPRKDWEKNLRYALESKCLSAYIEGVGKNAYIAFEKGHDFVLIEDAMRVVHMQFGSTLDAKEGDITKK